ncbi:MAG TPA: VWA domain-containing protein [Oculatellaceae cyanobacterium]
MDRSFAISLAVPVLSLRLLASFLAFSALASFALPVLADDAHDPMQGIPALPPIGSPRPRPLMGGSQSTTLQGGSQSTLLQGGSQSTMLQTGTRSTMLQSGTQSTLLQSKTESTLLQGGTTGTILQGGVEHIKEKLNILFLLDCSHSMKESFDGDGKDDPSEAKMNAAKKVLQESVYKIPLDVQIGLRTFGQGSGDNECHQSALLVPLGIKNRQEIVERVKAVKPFGVTPLEYALRQAAADDFAGAQGEKVIILISDGADTCNGHPCDFIQELPKYGIKLKVDVVGLSIKQPGDKDQLNCIAEGSNGKYYDVHTAGDLIKSIAKSVDKAIQGRIILHPNKPMNLHNTETVPETTTETHTERQQR